MSFKGRVAVFVGVGELVFLVAVLGELPRFIIVAIEGPDKLCIECQILLSEQRVPRRYTTADQGGDKGDDRKLDGFTLHRLSPLVLSVGITDSITSSRDKSGSTG